MSRFSCDPKENSCAPKLIFCAFMSRLSCVRMTLYADIRAFKCAYLQTFVRSKGKLVRSKTDNLCVYVQTIVRPKDLICRLSCVQNCLCPDFHAFQRKIRALQNWYFVLSCPEYRAYVAKCPNFRRSTGKLVRSKTDNLCVYVQTIVRSKDLICRLSCVQNCLCPLQKFVLSIVESAFKIAYVHRKVSALQNW